MEWKNFFSRFGCKILTCMIVAQLVIEYQEGTLNIDHLYAVTTVVFVWFNESNITLIGTMQDFNKEMLEEYKKMATGFEELRREYEKLRLDYTELKTRTEALNRG